MKPSGIFLSLLLSLFLASSCNWFGGKEKSGNPQTAPSAPPPEPELAATPGWKADMEGFSLVSGTGEEWVHAVGYTGNINQWRPADQYLISAADGSVRWKKRRTMKSYGDNAPWSIRLHLWDSRTFFYETRYKAVYSLSVADGATDRVIANAFHFAPCGKELFIGAAVPYFWNPQEKKSTPVADMKPVYGEVAVQTAPQFPATVLDDDHVAFRSTDGALRVISCSQHREIWRFADAMDRKVWTTDLPVSGGVVLASTLMPSFLPRTTVRGLTEDEVQLPGQLQTQWPLQIVEDRAVFVTTEGLGMVTLFGVDVKSGDVAYQVELPVIPCTRSERFHVCRNQKTVFAIELATGKKTMERDLPGAPRFMNAQGDFVTVQMQDDKILVLDMRDGSQAFSGEIRIKGASVELLKTAMAGPDRIALIVRTLWPTQPTLERLYLHAFAYAQPDKAVDMQLSKPQPDKVPLRAGTGEREVNLPVWVWDNQLYTAIDGRFQTVDITRGTTGNGYVLPGKGPVSLLRILPEGEALLERDETLVLMRPRGQMAWSASIRGQDVKTVTSASVVLASANSVNVLSLADGKPTGAAATGLPSPPSVRGATPEAVFFTIPSGGQVISAGKVEKTREMPVISMHFGARDLLVYGRNESPPGKGGWTALDLKTGNVLWQRTVSKLPETVGGAADIGEIEPREASYHPPSWVRASAQGFWVPDPSHRCLYLVRPDNGQVRWVRCAQRLGAPPVFTADGKWMLLPAAGPWHEPGKPVPDGVRIEKNLSLVALHTETFTLRTLYTPPENFSVVTPISGPRDSRLVVSVVEEKFKNPKCFLQSFQLAVPPPPAPMPLFSTP